MSDVIHKDKLCRNWFITINPNAICYKDIINIIASRGVKHYSYIYHDKPDEDNENINHIHLCIEFVGAKSFSAIQRLFDGAHIEYMKYKNQCYKYLIHLNEETGDSEYSIDKVISSNLDYFKYMISTNEFQCLDSHSIIVDVQQNGFTTITQFLEKYGMYQVRNFLGIIKSVLQENSQSIVNIMKENQELKRENGILKGKLADLEKELPF